ncbi:MAG TPA: penicillin-binding transpeptidase domain-containing protein [Bacteriovoracaceae bacterium]|nr:penicillin-binding transpeptidase domain-containing protein [Bacteriovoracaceae bacterium]HLW57313.1 penicillin-binding transpeptidase domain-containing protein [Bacteriovoracaceae bacterium]
MFFRTTHFKMLLLALLIILAALPAWSNLIFTKDNTLFQNKEPEFTYEDWTKIISSHKNWDEQLDYDNSKYKIEYSFNADLEAFIQRQLRMYHPDYTSVVVMDNETGELLAAVDYARVTKKFGRDITFSTTHPAASIIKVITAADLLENTHVKSDTEYHYTGKSTTLYRYQLREPSQRRRWTRKINFKKAFATSNNVIFGRSAVDNLTPAGLKKMAEKFGFNKEIISGIDLEPSSFGLAESTYHLAELASGLNRETVMSPVHGTLIASIIANEGRIVWPQFIKSLEGMDGKKIYPPLRGEEQVITQTTAKALGELFESTVTSGTARSAFRKHKKLLRDIEIGGKTGSITGGEPFGKRDWFVSYAKKRDSDDRGISIGIMIVNQKKWYVKSPFLAKNIIEYYYSQIYPSKLKDPNDG